MDALKEFYADRDANAQRFAELQEEAEERTKSAAAAAAAGSGPAPLSMGVFPEDWNKSQFWVWQHIHSFHNYTLGPPRPPPPSPTPRLCWAGEAVRYSRKETAGEWNGTSVDLRGGGMK